MKNNLTVLKLFLIILFTLGSVSYSQSPVDASIGVSVTTNFSWTTATTNATDFHLQVSTNSGAFTAPNLVLDVLLGNAVNSYTFNPSDLIGLTNNLDYNTTYYWRIYDANLSTAFEPLVAPNYYTFTTLLATPQLSSPADLATGVSITPSVSWTLADNSSNVEYTIFYDDDGELAIDKQQIGPFNTSPQSLPTLLYSTNYVWQVEAKVTSGPNINETTLSSIFSFTTRDIPTPSLFSPANTLTGVSILPSFSWTWSGSGTVTYEIQISASNSFGTKILDTVGVSTLSLPALHESHKLLNNTTYYWRVRVNQGTNYSNWATYSFKTIPVVTVSPINPINASTNVPFNPTYFSFQIVNGYTGTLKYIIQYRASATIPTIAEWGGANTITITNLLSELPMPATLLANQKYYWRVVVENASDEVVAFSGNYYFTTKSGAPKPYLSYPIGGQPVYTNSPSFYWYVGTYDLTDLSFDLVIATNQLFTAGVQTVSNILDIQYDWALASLTPGIPYYWKVITYYKRGTGEEQQVSSSYSSFKPMGQGTASTPYLSYPVGNLSVYTTTPTLYWYTGASTDGVVFDVYIKLSTGAYTKVADNLTDLYLDLSGALLNPFTLASGSTYNWYVVAQGVNGDFTSSVGTFNVSSSIGTGSPIASWPVGNPYVYSLTPSLYWYMYGSTTGLTKYVIKYKQIATAPVDWDVEGGTSTVDINDLNTTSYDIPTNLTAGAKYYWAVAGYNGLSRATSWSTGSFTVSTSSTVVNVYLSAPVGGTTVFTLTPTLYWYATGAISGITSYTLQYSNTSGFVSGPAPAYTTTVAGLTDNFYTLPSDLANVGVTIYWKVTVYYSGGGSSTSTTGSFVIDPNSSSVVPLVGSPINNVQVKSTAATLSWAIPAQTKSSLSYTLEYSDNSSFNNAKVVAGLKQNQYTVTDLKDNSTYYWRVKSNTDQKNSQFSEVAQFSTIGKVTGVETNEIPTEFSLEQNYPNPFNPSTVIKYSLPSNSFVTIKVFDMLGREVKTLVSRENSAGQYSVAWNGDDNFGNKVSTGVYIYRINAGDFSSSKKMLLVK